MFPIACDFSGIYGKGVYAAFNEKRLDTMGAHSIISVGKQDYIDVFRSNHDCHCHTS
jgi:hypothetical protein